jgi:hypothetical protein
MARSVEERLRDIEDRLEIYNLIASHPPSADTGAKDYTASVYTDDGVFDRGAKLSGATGNAAIAAGLTSPGHQAAIAGGIAHFTSLPHIALEDDRAVVTNYLQILWPQTQGDPVEVPNHGTSKGFRVHRVVANRWELVRTPAGWKIKHRAIRLMDGSEPDARRMLRAALEPQPAD